MSKNNDELFKNVTGHAKEYGFVFQSSEIYDGLSAVYDYGQLGAELKNNIKEYWWRFMTSLHDNIVGLDAEAIVDLAGRENKAILFCMGDYFFEGIIVWLRHKNQYRKVCGDVKILSNFRRRSYLLISLDGELNCKTGTFAEDRLKSNRAPQFFYSFFYNI